MTAVKRILIVDDHKTSLQALHAMLAGAGYEVADAANGVEALEEARRVRPDLVVSDILMPQMDGYSLCREMRRDPALRDVPIVLYTATYTSAQDEELARRSGAARYIVKPAEDAAMLAALRDVLQEREAGRLVAPSPGEEGETVYYRLYNQVLVHKLEDKLVELEREVASRKAAEREAHQLFDELHFALRAGGVGLWDWNLQTGKVRFSPEWGRQIGYDPHELSDDPAEWKKRLHPDDSARALRATQDCLEGKTPIYQCEFRLRHKDGSYRWIMSQGSLERDESGAPARLLGSHVDITESRRREEALRTADRLREAILDSISDGFMAFDRSWRCTFANRMAGEIVRRAPEDLIGRNLWDAFPEAIAQFSERFNAAMEAQVPLRLEEHFAPWGRWFEVRVYPFQDGVALYFTDVTDRKQTEEMLAQSQKMEAIGNLSGGMAHDFNNYLTVIIGNLELLKETMGGDPRSVKFADLALRGATRAAELTQHLLAYARQQPLDPKVTNVSERVAGVARLLGRILGEDIAMAVRTEPHVWPVLIDGPQLDSCLFNLASNARDAMPQGGELTITTANVHCTGKGPVEDPPLAAGDYVLVEVADTGSGIPAKLLAKVFEPFFTTKRPGHGTGLGLSMVYGFVKQSGGDMRIASEVGRGTRLRIYLPRVAEAGARGDAGGSPPSAPGGHESILLVEDNNSVRDTTAAQLASLGYQVIEAAGAEAALAILEGGLPVHLVFTDIVMPGMSGRDLAVLAAHRRPPIKVLLTSGFAGEAAPDSPTECVLRKPYRRDELARALRAVLDS
jgi:PAS domain S-box-containing protein